MHSARPNHSVGIAAEGFEPGPFAASGRGPDTSATPSPRRCDAALSCGKALCGMLLLLLCSSFGSQRFAGFSQHVALLAPGARWCIKVHLHVGIDGLGQRTTSTNLGTVAPLLNPSVYTSNVAYSTCCWCHSDRTTQQKHGF